MTGLVIPDAGTIGSASDNDALAISSGGVVTASQSIIAPAVAVDTISEKTGANGVAVDGVTIKDGQVPAGSGSSLVLIKAITADADTSIEFVHGTNGVVLDGTYNHYRWVFSHIDGSANAAFRAELSNDSGTTYHSGDGDYRTSGSAFYYNGTSHGSSTGYVTNKYLFKVETFHATYPVSGYLDLWSIHTTQMHCGRAGFLFTDTSNYATTQTMHCQYRRINSPIDGIKFYVSTGNMTSGTIAMYGFKHA